MQLMLQRNARPGRGRRLTYILYVSLLPDEAEHDIITRHRLGQTELFAIPEIELHLRQATDAFERSVNNDCLTEDGAKQFIANTASALYHNVVAWCGTRVLVRDALQGTTITCPDVYELLECERKIAEAFDKLDSTVRDVLAFDVGREENHLPDTDDRPTGTPSRAWANHFQWRR